MFEERDEALEFAGEARFGLGRHGAVAAELFWLRFLEVDDAGGEESEDRAALRADGGVELDFRSEAADFGAEARCQLAQGIALMGRNVVVDAAEGAGGFAERRLDFITGLFEAAEEDGDDAAVVFAELEFFGHDVN